MSLDSSVFGRNNFQRLGDGDPTSIRESELYRSDILSGPERGMMHRIMVPPLSISPQGGVLVDPSVTSFLTSGWGQRLRRSFVPRVVVNPNYSLFGSCYTSVVREADPMWLISCSCPLCFLTQPNANAISWFDPSGTALGRWLQHAER